jgi:hypothetical protein
MTLHSPWFQGVVMDRSTASRSPSNALPNGARNGNFQAAADWIHSPSRVAFRYRSTARKRSSHRRSGCASGQQSRKARRYLFWLRKGCTAADSADPQRDQPSKAAGLATTEVSRARRPGESVHDPACGPCACGARENPAHAANPSRYPATCSSARPWLPEGGLAAAMPAPPDRAGSERAGIVDSGPRPK